MFEKEIIKKDKLSSDSGLELRFSNSKNDFIVLEWNFGADK